MKINRFVALAAIALLVVAAMGAIGARTFAQSRTAAPAGLAVQSQDCAAEQGDDSSEAQNAGPDTDNVDLQCSDQNEADGVEADSSAGPDTETIEEQVGDQNAPDTGSEAETAGGPDTDTTEEQVGDQNAPDTGSEAESADGQDAAPTGTPAITADATQKTAEAYLNIGTAVKVELDDENGQLVYSVEFSGGTDVKVDAMTGAVLGVETGED